MITHVPAREVRYMTREKWWCSDLIHAHLSLAKAEECERKPTVDTTWKRQRLAREREARAVRRDRKA